MSRESSPKKGTYAAPERINSLEDVAYIFNKLEDEAVENSFAVYVKNKQPVVQHLGIGNFASVPVNVPAFLAGSQGGGRLWWHTVPDLTCL